MNSTPPSPWKVLAYSEDIQDHWDETQEALTCEWFISIGAMPDPTKINEISKTYPYRFVYQDWNYEHKDILGKPSDYKVNR